MNFKIDAFEQSVTDKDAPELTTVYADSWSDEND